MNTKCKNPYRLFLSSIILLGVISMAGCGGGGGGGGGGDKNNPPANPTSASISGTVSGTEIIAVNDTGDIVASDDTT
jgi:hypothetical protein